jgi:hypothetical protein
MNEREQQLALVSIVALLLSLLIALRWALLLGLVN